MEKEVKNENRLAKMEQKIDDLITDVKEIATDLKEHIRFEGEKYEKLDTKYSAKWVETGVIAIITAIIISAVIGIGTYFFKN